MSSIASNRQRFEDALAGKQVDHPVYAVYDWFVEHRSIDWQSLFDQGLGRINHATPVTHVRPHVQVSETRSIDSQGRARTDIRWVTDVGELHEWYLGEWRQESLIKGPRDYAIMARALSDVTVSANPEAFRQSETSLGDNGITIAVPEINRTPFQKIQVDFAGLEQFSYDLALGTPQLLELIEVMNDLLYRDIAAIATTPARQVKLWENLTIETMGPDVYRRHLVPVYRRVLDILDRAGQRLAVHYDGKLSLISKDIRELGFDGLDSLTPPPEGDLDVGEARSLWPSKFLWLHPTLGWFAHEDSLRTNVRRMIEQAGGRRFCLMISEDIPPNWQRTVPLILELLREH